MIDGLTLQGVICRTKSTDLLKDFISRPSYLFSPIRSRDFLAECVKYTRIGTLLCVVLYHRCMIG